MRRVLVGMSLVVVVGLGLASAACSDSAQPNLDAKSARDLAGDGPQVLDAKRLVDAGGDAGDDGSRDAFVHVDGAPRDALVHVDAAKQDAAQRVDFGQPDASTGGFGAVSARYAKMLEQSIDYWRVLNVDKYTTGHICKKTSLATCDPAYCNKPYVTPKIHRLAGLMVSLSKVYPYVNNAYKSKILTTLTNIYSWIYRRIDWTQKLVSDDYGACYKGDPKAYSHLTTALVVQGFRAFRNVLNKSDPKYTRLSNVTESLAVSQMNATDAWMTPIGATPKAYSTNFMALNLSVVSVINSVNSKNAYLVNLGHRLKTDYAWIRKAWVNYANEQYCGAPLLYGGWSHSPPDQAAKNNDVTFDCKYFDQAEVDTISKSIRSYYLEKTSYHVITTEGLMAILQTLESRKDCGLVSYGSAGTCAEMRMILGGAAAWVHSLMTSSGRIPTAFASFKKDEFGYFSDDAGTAIGTRNMIQSLDLISRHGTKSISVAYKFGGLAAGRMSLPSFKAKTLIALKYLLNKYTLANNKVDPWTITLEDAPFLAEKLF